MSLVAFALAYAGFIALSLGMARHRAQLLPVWRAPAWVRPAALALGWMALLLSGWLSVVFAQPNHRDWMAGGAADAAYGAVQWCGLLTLAALALAFLLAYRPRVALSLAPVLFCGALLAMAAGLG